MIKVLSNNFKDIFYESIVTSRQNILLCAPFVKASVIKRVLNNKPKNVNLNLVTYYNLNYFWSKSSDISAIESIINSNNKVYNCNQLHSKVYIFDNNKIIITSANLTYSALHKNIECGIITDDNNAIKEATNLMNIHCIDENLINSKNVTLSKSILDNMPKPNITLDYNTHEEIIIDKNNKILQALNGWTKEIYIVVNNIRNNPFYLNDINRYKDYFKSKYPNNNNIEAKIRQQLQILRNIGLLKFMGNGVYLKLWNN